MFNAQIGVYAGVENSACRRRQVIELAGTKYDLTWVPRAQAGALGYRDVERQAVQAFWSPFVTRVYH